MLDLPPCVRCGSTAQEIRPKPYTPGQNALYCGKCGAWIKWLPKDKNHQPEKRPKLKAGTTKEVWDNARGHCAHCGLSTEYLELLGLERTVQHVPPYKINGHEGYLIPLCSWCQQDSARTMKKLETIVSRLVKKFSV